MPMNEQHQQLCSSPEWADAIRDRVLPAVLAGLDLGPDVLEIGPGFGAATRVLAEGDFALTALEVNPESVERLSVEFGAAVRLVHGDGTAMPFPDLSFSAVVCFTMLHHVPSPAAQDRLFAETARVLRSGGVFAGSDSTYSPELSEFHTGDTFVPVDPATLPMRLTEAGFTAVDVVPGEGYLTFRAAKS
jgi:SAM-dependent methyltransferase